MRRQRESFFSLPALILMGALIALVLYLLFPRQWLFEDPDYLEKPDGVPIAYLTALLKSDSDNVPLRLSLAGMLVATGQLEQADKILQPLLSHHPVVEQAFADYLELQGQRIFAVPEGPTRRARQDELYAAAQKLLRQPYQPQRLLELLRPLRNWISDPRYLSLLQSAQERMITPDQQLQLAREVARLEEAQSRPGAAAATLKPHLGSVSPADRAEFIDNMIRLELASGDPKAALELFKRRQPAQSMAEKTLSEGIRLARLAGASADEAAWIRQRANANPGNLNYQRQLLASQLAAGRPLAAITALRRLQQQPARLTPADRKTIAEVLEWNNLPAEALPVWVSLYRDTGSPLAFRRATDLARGLFQWETLLGVLEQAASRGRLQPEDYIGLAEAQIRTGRLDAAIATLSEGRLLYPDAARLTERLLTLHLNLRDFPAAITLLEGQPTLSESDRVQLASLLWRTRQPERALALLNVGIDDPELAENAQIIRLDLATYLGRTDILRKEYDRLSARGDDELTPVLEERLLGLAVLFKDYPQALRLSQRRFEATGEPRLLAAMAEYQAVLERWSALATTLDRWRDLDPGARQNPRYWSLLALVHQRNNNIKAANEAYRTAWQLTPDDENLMINWAWLTLANAGEFADLLQALLTQIGDSPSTAAYPVLAYGYVALGKPGQALHWFRRGMTTRTDDIDWLLGTASVMTQTGQPGAATNLRQKAAVQLREDASTPANRFAIYREEGLLRLAWQALAGSHRTPEGTTADGNLHEAFAYFAADQGDAGVAEALLPIASSRSQNSYQRIEQRLYPTPENRQQSANRYIRQIDQLDKPMAATQRQDTTRDTVNLHQSFNRAIQLGARWQDLGNFTVQRAGITGQSSHDELRWQLSAHEVTANTSGRLQDTPGGNIEAALTLDRRSGNAIWSLTASQLPRYQGGDLALAARYDSQWSDRLVLGAGYQFRERTPDSAEAWWLTRRNRGFINTGYTPFSRLNLNLQAEHLTIENLNSESLADGYVLDLNATYTLFRNDPAWTMSAGYRNQQLSLTDTLPASTLAALDQPLAASAVLTEEYEHVGFATRWFHGEPHALYRSTPSPRAFLGLEAGYVLSTSTPEVGVDLGLGWRVLGDDELALSGRWSSEGLDGNGRTEFNLTYTIYLGR
ncbi:tetratricopeptide repeat protein [Marinobacter sp.]|uniref:tetratricopeptide repeat protein n=1 Tax=Marinobacter sp. TaxID=50741 RepID=UPI002B47D8D2|nr:tetratricopeptide repeat protein [Marinobacter sp.]HKK55416.1 tetratricopeptide repeat protein [Marinobacter sp.]